jgi:hypothetical protein
MKLSDVNILLASGIDVKVACRCICDRFKAQIISCSDVLRKLEDLLRGM